MHERRHRKLVVMNISVNTGNFTVAVKGTLKPDVQEDIINKGGLYELQRGGLSAAYVALGGVANEKGKLQLPKDFTRDSVEYSDDSASCMVTAIKDWAPKFFDGEVEISVSQYEGAEAQSPMKRASALVDSFLGKPEEAAYRTILGLPDGDRDALVAEANKRGLGIQPPKAKA